MTEPMPQMYNHCVAVYTAMAKTAKPVVLPPFSTSGDSARPERLIWEGFLTKLIGEDCNLAVPYYTSVKNNLVRMGCIEQVGRGGGTHPSTWELFKEPTEDLFNAKGTVRTHSKTSILEGQIKDLNSRVQKLEDMLQNIA